MFANSFHVGIKKITIHGCTVLAIFAASSLLGQQTSLSSKPSTALELPVTMRQNVVAGKTRVGTRVQAKLTVATLVNGVVVPRDAILSGEVTESVAKSATEPCRLALRIDSVQWKKQLLPLKLYLTAWYYPIANFAPADDMGEPPEATHPEKKWDGSTAHSERQFPSVDITSDTTPGQDPTFPSSGPRPALKQSKHRTWMSDVEAVRNGKDGTVALTARRFNIKLDKSTTYVFAAGVLSAGPH
jgi:hypothetical protein